MPIRNLQPNRSVAEPWHRSIETLNVNSYLRLKINGRTLLCAVASPERPVSSV